MKNICKLFSDLILGARNFENILAGKWIYFVLHIILNCLVDLEIILLLQQDALH